MCALPNYLSLSLLGCKLGPVYFLYEVCLQLALSCPISILLKFKCTLFMQLHISFNTILLYETCCKTSGIMHITSQESD